MSGNSLSFARREDLEIKGSHVALSVDSPSVEINLSPVTSIGADPVDSLSSESVTRPLAARQGKVLDAKIDAVRTDYGSHETDFAAHFNTILT